MKRLQLIFGLAVFCALAVIFVVTHPRGAQAMTPTPVIGYTIHIDAEKHLSGHPKEVAHHWCKTFSPNLIQCMLFDADGPNGHLIGVENIVPTALWKTFPASERRLWHYHRVEIPLVNAKTPDMTPAESKALVASLLETYGKIVIFWDPMTSSEPVGHPAITIMKGKM